MANGLGNGHLSSHVDIGISPLLPLFVQRRLAGKEVA